MIGLTKICDRHYILRTTKTRGYLANDKERIIVVENPVVEIENDTTFKIRGTFLGEQASGNIDGTLHMERKRDRTVMSDFHDNDGKSISRIVVKATKSQHCRAVNSIEYETFSKDGKGMEKHSQFYVMTPSEFSVSDNIDRVVSVILRTMGATNASREERDRITYGVINASLIGQEHKREKDNRKVGIEDIGFLTELVVRTYHEIIAVRTSRLKEEEAILLERIRLIKLKIIRLLGSDNPTNQLPLNISYGKLKDCVRTALSTIRGYQLKGIQIADMKYMYREIVLSYRTLTIAIGYLKQIQKEKRTYFNTSTTRQIGDSSISRTLSKHFKEVCDLLNRRGIGVITDNNGVKNLVYYLKYMYQNKYLILSDRADSTPLKRYKLFLKAFPVRMDELSLNDINLINKDQHVNTWTFTNVPYSTISSMDNYNKTVANIVHELKPISSSSPGYIHLSPVDRINANESDDKYVFCGNMVSHHILEEKLRIPNLSKYGYVSSKISKISNTITNPEDSKDHNWAIASSILEAIAGIFQRSVNTLCDPSCGNNTDLGPDKITLFNRNVMNYTKLRKKIVNHPELPGKVIDISKCLLP